MIVACQNRIEPDKTPNPNDIDAINELHAQSEAALLAGDLDTYITLLDEDAVALWPDVSPIVGKENIRTWFRDNIFERLNYVEMTHETEEIVANEPWAIWWGYGSGVVTPKAGGEQSTFRVKSLEIMRRQEDGSWRFWRLINVKDYFGTKLPHLKILP